MVSAQPLGILLKHQGHDIFARYFVNDFIQLNGSTMKENRVIFLTKCGVPYSYHPYHPRLARVDVKKLFVPKFKHDPMLWYLSEIYPQKLWEDGKEAFNVDGLKDFVGCHVYRTIETHAVRSYEHERLFHVLLGFGYGFEPWVRILNLKRNQSISGELARGDWERVAQLANLEAGRPEYVAHVNVTSMIPQYTGDWTVVLMLRATVEDERSKGWGFIHVRLRAEFWRVESPHLISYNGTTLY